MATRESVSDWLNRYVDAWKSYDPQAIGDLFSENAEYYYGPYHGEPLRGRDAIVVNWLDNKDAPGTYEASYSPIAVEGDVGVSNGRSTYYNSDRSEMVTQYDNIFVMRFDKDGRCSEFREWFMEKPKPKEKG
ncbi:MAG: nuclear transport factor 2 family protein [Chloroflexia bacterium]